MGVSLTLLDYAKEKMLEGNFSLAASYYQRALVEGVPEDIVNLRYLTKNYLVYPIEYENSDRYFSLLQSLHALAENETEYANEYVQALGSLLELKTMFMRALSLFYFSDIEVSSRNSIVINQIAVILNYIRKNKTEILESDVYDIKRYCSGVDMSKFARELNIIEAYCMNLLLSYTAVQDQAYLGKTYSAHTIDYGYYAETTINSRDRYLNWAVLKPRVFVIGGDAYYNDFLRDYQLKLQELSGFDSPKKLREELNVLVKHKYSKNGSNKEFFEYAKHFEKEDSSRSSYFSDMNKLANAINPLNRLNVMNMLFDKKNVCSFELDEYFRRKKLCGVCDMISAGQSWSIDTVRWCMAIAGCFGIGILVYIALAISMRNGMYWGITIEKH